MELWPKISRRCNSELTIFTSWTMESLCWWSIVKCTLDSRVETWNKWCGWTYLQWKEIIKDRDSRRIDKFWRLACAILFIWEFVYDRRNINAIDLRGALKSNCVCLEKSQNLRFSRNKLSEQLRQPHSFALKITRHKAATKHRCETLVANGWIWWTAKHNGRYGSSIFWELSSALIIVFLATVNLWFGEPNCTTAFFIIERLSFRQAWFRLAFALEGLGSLDKAFKVSEKGSFYLLPPEIEVCIIYVNQCESISHLFAGEYQGNMRWLFTLPILKWHVYTWLRSASLIISSFSISSKLWRVCQAEDWCAVGRPEHESPRTGGEWARSSAKFCKGTCAS